MSNELAKRWHGVGQGSRPRTAGSFSPVARVLDSLGHTSNSQLASHLGLKQPGGQGWRSLASCQSTVAEACIIAASPAEGSTEPKPPKPLGEVLSDAGRKALGGGVPGMVAMATQVGTPHEQGPAPASGPATFHHALQLQTLLRFFLNLGPLSCSQALAQSPAALNACLRKCHPGL